MSIRAAGQEESISRREEREAWAPGGRPVRMSNVVAALSRALDLTEGQPEGHAMRSALIGMRLADEIGMDATRRGSLFYALLLKDLGCSSNAAKLCYLFGSDERVAKRDLKTRDWTDFREAARYAGRHVSRGRGSLLKKAVRFTRLGLGGESASRELVQIRCERGADIARMLGLPEETASAIHSLDEHWDGAGHPNGTRGEEIPLLGRILALAQTVEVFHREFGRSKALETARARRGTWFDPQLADTLAAIGGDEALWRPLEDGSASERLGEWEPADLVVHATEDRIDLIARAFARVVDAKSPWTYRHSERVTDLALHIAAMTGVSAESRRDLQRAALLHDLGKLGVSNLVLDKDGPLTDEEFRELQTHATYTEEILSRVGVLKAPARIAGAHHERLDGSGYPRGVTGALLGAEVRALAVADVFEALTADRPYRPAHSHGRALEIMRADVGKGLCGDAFAALLAVLVETGGEPWLNRPPLASELCGEGTDPAPQSAPGC